jgi:hypothetical protein
VEEKGRVAVILVAGRRKLGLALTIERRKSCIFAGCVVGLVLGVGDGERVWESFDGFVGLVDGLV